MDATYDVQVSVFGQNEAGRIDACLRSISAALGVRHAIITLLLNGSTDGSEGIARATARTLKHPLRICRIGHADKSNAINHSFYDLRERARLYVFVDAYATISPETIGAFEARLSECPDANVATGLAGNGRNEPKSNERTVRQGGIIHGQLYAARPEFLDRLTAKGLRLPIGLYRGDGLIGYLACHDLDAVGNEWENRRLVGTAGATFMIDQLSPFRWRDIRRQLRRKVRQMRGRIENVAIERIASAHGFTALPGYADEMIRDYLAGNPLPNAALLDQPFLAIAVWQHRRAAPPHPDQMKPVCTPP